MPQSQIEFLRASEYSLSAKVSEAVEVLMAKEGYTPGAVANGEMLGVKPICPQDMEEWLKCRTDVEKCGFLVFSEYSDSDQCAYLRCNRKQLERLKAASEAEEERKMNDVMGVGLEAGERECLAAWPGPGEAECLIVQALARLRLTARSSEREFREWTVDFEARGLLALALEVVKGRRRTAAGEAELRRMVGENGKVDTMGAEVDL